MANNKADLKPKKATMRHILEVQIKDRYSFHLLFHCWEVGTDHDK